MVNSPNLGTGVLLSVVPLKTWHHQRWGATHIKKWFSYQPSLIPSWKCVSLWHGFSPEQSRASQNVMQLCLSFWRFVWGFGYIRINKWGSQICALRDSLRDSSPSFSGLYSPSSHSHRKRAPQPSRPLAEPWFAARMREQQGSPGGWRRLVVRGGAAGSGAGEDRARSEGFPRPEGTTPPGGNSVILLDIPSWLQVFIYCSLLRCYFSI